MRTKLPVFSSLRCGRFEYVFRGASLKARGRAEEFCPLLMGTKGPKGTKIRRPQRPEFCLLCEKRRQNSVSACSCVDRARNKSSEGQGLGRRPEPKNSVASYFFLTGTKLVYFSSLRRRRVSLSKRYIERRLMRALRRASAARRPCCRIACVFKNKLPKTDWCTHEHIMFGG